MGFFTFLLLLLVPGVLIGIVFVIQRLSKQQQDIDLLKNEVRRLQEQVFPKNAQTEKSQSSAPVQFPSSVPIPDPVHVKEIAIAVEAIPPTQPIPPTKPRIPDVPVNVPPRGSFGGSSRWHRTEKYILQNLTGILGTLGVVLGLGFLGVYTALMLAPVFRVAGLVLVCTVVAIVALRFARVPKWRSLAQWSQSAAAAVFLLACLGSGGIPGLQWISNPLIAWAVLSLGVAVNLFVAFIRKSSIFASVHTLLGLAALAVAGPSEMVVGTMAVVAILGLTIARKARWDFHLALTEAGFVGILLYFYFSGSAHSDSLKIVCTFGLIAVFVVGQSLHYRKIQATPYWDTKSTFTHLLFWALTGLGLFLYALQDKLLLTLSLAGASVLVGLIARSARKRGILWLYKIDTLFSLTGAFGAILSLVAWQLALTPALILILVVSQAFTVLMIFEKEHLMARIGCRLTEISTILIAAVAATGADGLAIAVTGLLIGAFQMLFVDRLKNFEAPASLFDLFLPWIFVLAALVVPPGTFLFGLPASYGLVCTTVLLFLWQRKKSSRLLRIGLQTSLLVFAGIEWFLSARGLVLSNPDPIAILNVALPLVLLPLLGLIFTKTADDSLRKRLLWALGASVFLASVLVLLPQFAYCLPMALLGFGIACLWLSRLKMPSLSSSILALGYSFLLGFVALFVPLVLYNSQTISGFPVRWLLEGIAAIAVLTTYFTRRFWGTADASRLKLLSMRLLEVLLLLVTAVLLVETPIQFAAAGIALWALLCLASSLHPRVQKRVRIYSLYLFWLSAIYFAIQAATQTLGYEALVAGILQGVWIALALSTQTRSADNSPIGTSLLLYYLAAINRRYALLVVMPIAVLWAFCVSRVFDSALLTLIWSIEAVAIFALALVLRRPFFRIVSLIGLGACIVRLVFFDLQQADTISRALVFLGMGLLLLGMNVLYIRFKSRVSD